MFAALLLLASPQQTAFEAAKPEIESAIASDLLVIGLTGNGSVLASLWVNAGPDAGVEPQRHIQDLTCARRRGTYHCTFILLREGGVARAFDMDSPDRIACSATFHRVEERGELTWRAQRMPPGPRGGDSRTTMKCRVAPLR